MQMLMPGDPIGAAEAYRLGMVNELHEPAELMGAALRIAAFNDDRDPVFRDADY